MAETYEALKRVTEKVGTEFDGALVDALGRSIRDSSPEPALPSVASTGGGDRLLRGPRVALTYRPIKGNHVREAGSGQVAARGS